MIKALIRFLLFFVPVSILNGINFILFDNVEIVGVTFDLTRRKKINKKDLELKSVKNFLKNCLKDSGDLEVNDGKKKTDK